MRKAPVQGKVDRLFSPKAYLLLSEGGSPDQTLQGIRADKVSDGALCFVRSQERLYRYDKSYVGPINPPESISTPNGGAWIQVISIDEDAGQYLLVDGTRPMTGALNLAGNQVLNMPAPTESTDGANKQYVDTKLSLDGGTMSGVIAMAGSKITGVGAPTESGDAVNKSYVDGLNGVALGGWVYAALFGDGLDETNNARNLTLTAGQTADLKIDLLGIR